MKEGGIHINTVFQLELQAEIGALKNMRLHPPYDELISDISGFYDLKIAVYKRLTDIVGLVPIFETNS